MMNATEKLQRVKALLRNILADAGRCQEMLKLLEAQRMSMIRRDTEALETLNEVILSQYTGLNAGADERSQLLTELGLPANQQGIETVCGWLPGAQRQRARADWNNLEQGMRHCRSYNEQNGLLLTRQYEFVQRFLGTEPDFLYSR